MLPLSLPVALSTGSQGRGAVVIEDARVTIVAGDSTLVQLYYLPR